MLHINQGKRTSRARLLDLGKEGRLCPCWSNFREVAQSCTPSTHKSPEGQNTRNFFELADGKENKVLLFVVRCRALFQQKDFEPEPQPKDLS